MFLLLLLDTDCSGRTLATLLVAWVAVAMVASVLLQWKYMWIILTVLTLLFLLVCAYIAYNAKRTYARALIDEERARRASTREREIWTVSGVTADNRGEAGASQYATHPFTDLPPSYTSVVLAQTTITASGASLTNGDPLGVLKFEDPPSYSTVISSINTHDRGAEVSNEVSNALPSLVKTNNVVLTSSSQND